MKNYIVKEIYPWLYSVKEHDVFVYVVVGAERALVFDTAYGVYCLPDTVRQITSKPYDVVVSHGHIDHSCGCYEFPEVWMSEQDFGLCEQHTSPEFRARVVKNLTGALPDGFDAESYMRLGTGNLKKLPAGAKFELGGITAAVIDMPGHTQGSIGLLLEQKRVLLAGDAANSHIWMFMPETSPLKDYTAMLERVKLMEFDTFYTGHSDEPSGKPLFDSFITVANEVKSADSVPYGLTEFADFEPYFYQKDGIGIVFNKGKLNK